MLRSHAFVAISPSEAKRLIGHGFSPAKALRADAQDKQEHAKFFRELVAANPNDLTNKEILADLTSTAARYIKEIQSVRPYLCRAVGVERCNTGRFSAWRESKEVWIGFLGLGLASTPYNQPVVIYLDSPPSAIHIKGPSTCL